MLSKLDPDFPELSPSKLRFLEDRGLIHPARTASGYRNFSDSDIERIKLVLLMQRDHYLPLKVIRKYLADLDAGRNPEWPGTADRVAHRSSAPSTAGPATSCSPRRTRAPTCSATRSPPA